ncbi:MAG: disulfide reductase [Candidatus Lokiarchaeota archaeon]|nr:disulfide reductase [Candidatus Lokiarchaeota archaeon]
MSESSLEDFKKQLVHCLHCHLCFAANWHELDDWLAVCPTASRFGFESFYASGRIELARAIIEKSLRVPTDRLLDIFYTCTGCGACFEQCHELSGFDVNQVDLFEAIKALFYERGWGPLEKHKEFANSIIENHNPYHEPHENRFKWLNNQKISSDASLIYFVGCTSSYRRVEIAKATVEVLKKSNTSFRIMGPDEWCCGSPLIRTGQVDIAKDLAAHNIEKIESIGAETVIFSCAGCYRTFKNDYEKLGFSIPFKVKHTSQYFLNLMRKNKLNGKSLSKVVTYHDPCHLGRHSRVYKQPRNVLKRLGIEINEMARNMENTFCCGAGSGVRAAYPKFANWTARKRIQEAINTDAQILASTCPFCKNNFMEAIEAFKTKLKIYDLSEILMEALND